MKSQQIWSKMSLQMAVSTGRARTDPSFHFCSMFSWPIKGQGRIRAHHVGEWNGLALTRIKCSSASLLVNGLITIDQCSWFLIFFGYVSEINVKCDPISRVKSAKKTQAALKQIWLDIGPANMRLCDLWTVLPPNEISTADLQALKIACPDFTPGWLTDLVVVHTVLFFYYLEKTHVPTSKVHNFLFLIRILRSVENWI